MLPLLNFCKTLYAGIKFLQEQHKKKTQTLHLALVLTSLDALTHPHQGQCREKSY